MYYIIIVVRFVLWCQQILFTSFLRRLLVQNSWVRYKCWSMIETDTWEGIGTNKTGSLRECIIFHHWYFLRINFWFQPKVCDGYDMTQKSMSFKDIATITFWKMIIGFIFGAWKVLTWVKKVDIFEKKFKKVTIMIEVIDQKQWADINNKMKKIYI